MQKLKQKKFGNIGIQLKTTEINLIDNYNEFYKRNKKLKKTKREKNKKKKKKKKKKTKRVEIHKKIDPLFKIIEESQAKPKAEIKIKEISKKEDKKEEDKKEISKKKDKKEISKKEDKKEISNKQEEGEKEEEIKKVKIESGQVDLTERHPDIKSLTITAPTDPEPKKKGHNIKLE